MKKLLFLALVGILSATPVYAERGHGGRPGGGFSHGHGHGGGSDNWIFPALIGGLLLYGLTQQQAAEVQPTPYEQPPQIYEPSAVPSTPPISVPYWYFCPAANGYYPRVPACPSGWTKIPTTPPDTFPEVPN